MTEKLLNINQILATERVIMQYKLYIDMVPHTSWYQNLRQVISKEKWEELREAIFMSQNYCCQICNANQPLQAHEVWHYDYNNFKQILHEIIGICENCHMVKHLGHAELKLIPAGKTTLKELSTHWMSVNNSSAIDFRKHRKLAYQLWESRSQWEWDVVDTNGRLITDLNMNS